MNNTFLWTSCDILEAGDGLWIVCVCVWGGWGGGGLRGGWGLYVTFAATSLVLIFSLSFFLSE